MNDPTWDSLLSAFHDGELVPGERERVERLLVDSEEARAELDDYRRLAESFQELPRERLPVEFAAEVLQCAERRMLLPDSRTAVVKSTATRRRFGWSSVVALTATAAVALVLVARPARLWGPAEPIGEQAAKQNAPGAVNLPMAALDATDESAEPAQAEPDRKIAANETARDSKLPEVMVAKLQDRGGLAKSGATRPGEMKSDAAANGSSNGKLAAVPAPKMAAAEAKAADETAAAKPMRAIDGTAGLVFSENLQELKVGDLIEALQADEGQVTVVKLLVVDRRAGLESLQLLLARNEIRPEAKLPAGTDKDSPVADAKRKATDPGGDMVAVFVEATDAQLAKALESLRLEPDTFLGLDVEGPIELAARGEVSSVEVANALDQNRQLVASGRVFKRADTVRGAAARASSVPGNATPSAAAPAAPAMALRGRRGPAGAAGKAAASQLEQAESEKERDGRRAEGESRQMVVVVPEVEREVLKEEQRAQEKQQRRKKEQPADAPALAGVADKSETGEKAKAGELARAAGGSRRMAANQRSVQVIFLFEEAPLPAVRQVPPLPN